jgi:hypothetical protein
MVCPQCPSLPASRRLPQACGGTSAPSATPLAPSDADLFVEHPGRFYARLWSAHLESAAAIRSLVAALHARESQALGADTVDGARAFGLETPREASDGLREKAARVVEMLVGIADLRLSPAGLERLRISPIAYLDRFLETCMESETGNEWRKQFRPDRFDPVAVWDALVEDWGGTVAEETVLGRAARRIEEYFWLEPGAPVKTQRNGVVLECRVYLDAHPVPADAKRLHHTSWNDLSEFMGALRTFAAWVGDDELAAIAPTVAARFDAYTYRIASRKREPITARLVLTTYHTKFVWWFEQGLAQQLQVFLGLYGKRMRAPVAGEAAA